ncbi:MAG: hypothetical protein NZM29_06865, partial [Nitrospira sp.]|nr:hypothetical protein [Nitrospira sp.]
MEETAQNAGMPNGDPLRSSSPIRIIGIGNEMRGDDAVGLLAARRLREMLGERSAVVEAGR